jgi:hypothetical protein
MGRNGEAIVLSREERETLDAWARGTRLAQRLVQRAQIIRMAAPMGTKSGDRAGVEGF